MQLVLAGAGVSGQRRRFNYHQFCFAPGLNILNQHRTPFEAQSLSDRSSLHGVKQAEIPWINAIFNSDPPLFDYTSALVTTDK